MNIVQLYHLGEGPLNHRSNCFIGRICQIKKYLHVIYIFNLKGISDDYENEVII